MKLTVKKAQTDKNHLTYNISVCVYHICNILSLNKPSL